MKKLNFYGLQVKDGRRFLHRFRCLDDLRTWINGAVGEARSQEYATGFEVRRVLRRIKQDETLTWPVEVD